MATANSSTPTQSKPRASPRQPQPRLQRRRRQPRAHPRQQQQPRLQRRRRQPPPHQRQQQQPRLQRRRRRPRPHQRRQLSPQRHDLRVQDEGDVVVVEVAVDSRPVVMAPDSRYAQGQSRGDVKERSTRRQLVKNALVSDLSTRLGLWRMQRPQSSPAAGINPGQRSGGPLLVGLCAVP